VLTDVYFVALIFTLFAIEFSLQSHRIRRGERLRIFKVSDDAVVKATKNELNFF